METCYSFTHSIIINIEREIGGLSEIRASGVVHLSRIHWGSSSSCSISPISLPGLIGAVVAVVVAVLVVVETVVVVVIVVVQVIEVVAVVVSHSRCSKLGFDCGCDL